MAENSTGKRDKKTQKRFNALFRRGTEMLHRDNIDRAIELLERAYQINPQHVDTAVNLSGAYILTKKFKKAVPILEFLTKVDPDQTMIWVNLGAAYLGNPVLAREEEQRQAITAFQHALEITPDAPHVAYNIGLVYRDLNENEEAIRWFQKAVQANPNDQDARNLIKRLKKQTANGK